METHTRQFILAFIAAILTFMTACNQKTPVDLIVHNANIYTVDNNFSKAHAFAVKDGKFVAVGDEETIMRQYAAKETIDAQDDAVYPGFMDGHSHFTGYGENLASRCTTASTLPNGSWVAAGTKTSGKWPSSPITKNLQRPSPTRKSC